MYSWVLSTLLPSSLQDDLDDFNLFNPSASKTVKWMQDYTWNVSYSDSTFAQGEVILDTVTIGDFAITNQAIGVASDAGGSFLQNNLADGIMGLAFSSLNTIRPKTTNIIGDNLAKFLPYPVFTADLKHKANGTYEFGRIDPDKYDGPINYVPLVPYKPLGEIAFWQFNVTNFQVEGGPVTSAPGTAIAGMCSSVRSSPDYSHHPMSFELQIPVRSTRIARFGAKIYQNRHRHNLNLHQQ